MIRPMLAVSQQTFLLLKRDKIFWPAAIGGILIALFAQLASGWSIEDFTKILFDIGIFGFNLIGSLVAMLWGVKVITDSRQEGFVEVQLAAPISRTAWFIGKYLGLMFALLMLGIILMVVWQGFMLLGLFGIMTIPHISIFLYMILGWWVVAASAQFFASLTSPAIALFATICLWIAGLGSAPIAHSLGNETPAITRSVVGFLARIWDLHQFDISTIAVIPQQFTPEDLLWRVLYGISLLLFLVTLSCLHFSRKDLASS